jgi:hypothetical protein
MPIVGILFVPHCSFTFSDVPTCVPVAGQFKKAFEDARENNAKLAGAGSAASPPRATEKPEETAEDESESDGEDEAEGNANAPAESDVPGTETGDSEKKTGEE